jgi:hypothetical protein
MALVFNFMCYAQVQAEARYMADPLTESATLARNKTILFLFTLFWLKITTVCNKKIYKVCFF